MDKKDFKNPYGLKTSWNNPDLFYSIRNILRDLPDAFEGYDLLLEFFDIWWNRQPSNLINKCPAGVDKVAWVLDNQEMFFNV